MEVGAHVGELADQREVEPLVDHAEEADPRVRDQGLVRRIGELLARGGEVRHVDARRERVDVVVAGALVLVQAVAAGEHDVRALEERPLAPDERRWRAVEQRQLVHAVVDDGARLHVVREGDRHRRVVPEHGIRRRQLADQPIDHLALERLGGRRRRPGGQVWLRDQHAGLGLVEDELGLAVPEHGFLIEDHPAVTRASTHEVLRPLVDEPPTQVRQAQDGLGRLSHVASHCTRRTTGVTRP